jgi:AcrR family transcriptional regulator
MSPRRAKAVGGGRVGDDPAAALRELLIDATEGLLAQGPIAAITTRDIARAAAVSDGVLYNYFDDKAALIVAALVRRYRRLARRFFESLPEAGSATVEENVEVFAAGFLDLLVDSVPTIAGLLTEPALFHSLFAEIHRDELGPQYMLARLDEYLREERRLGRLTVLDFSSVGTLLMGAAVVLALSHHFAPLSDRAALSAQLRPTVATILRGLA